MTPVKLELTVCTVAAKCAVLIMGNGTTHENSLKSCKYVHGKKQDELCWLESRRWMMFIIRRIKVTGWGECQCTSAMMSASCFVVFGANLELPQAAATFK